MAAACLAALACQQSINLASALIRQIQYRMVNNVIFLFFRILVGLFYAFIVYLSHNVQETKGQFPTYFYILILASYALHQVRNYIDCIQRSI